MKVNEDKSQAIYFPHRLRSPEAHLTMKGQSIPLISLRKYLIIFDKRISWNLHIEMIEAKAFRTFIIIYSCDGGVVVSLMHWPPFNPRKIPGTYFC
jgi:hypothetical protein